MAEEKRLELNDEQVAEIVKGFVQLWIKFEAKLHEDMAKAFNLDKEYIGNEHQADYYIGLFYRVSSIIYPRNQVSMGDLSKELAVPFSKATRIINLMVDSSFVTRLSDPDDRRVVLVALTDKGKKLHDIVDNYTRERVQQLLGSGLTSEERTILLTLIYKTVSALKKAAG